AGPGPQGRRSHGAGDDARQAGTLREAALPPPGADGEPGARAERGPAGLDERARAGGEEESVTTFFGRTGYGRTARKTASPQDMKATEGFYKGAMKWPK